MTHILEEFRTFLDHAPTSWHAVQEVGNRLAVHDFIPLSEGELWQLEPGGKYFVVRGGSLCAFIIPTAPPKEAVILAAHTDSPALKVKPIPEIKKNGMTTLGVEVYGAPLLNSWLNRDLGIAGRIFVADSEGNIDEKLVNIDDAPLVIPQLAIHFDREIDEKGLVLNKQEHLCPLLTLGESEAALEALLRRYLHNQKLISYDLFLYPLEKSRFIGLSNEMLASYRIDNLTGVHACLSALACTRRPQSELLQCAVFWDHEEIGSGSPEGAGSPFLNDTLKRIAVCLNLSEEEFLILKSQSLAISVDMAHGLNPNYEKFHDVQHRPILGKGVAFKYNANYRFASTSASAARLLQLAQKLNLTIQPFVTRSDLRSGSTVGPILAQATGIPAVDIGCPQLSMHSVREVIAVQDYFDLCRILTHALQKEE